MESNRTLIDRIGKVSESTLTRLRDAGAAASSAGTAMALKFKSGDRVVDQATGKSGVVRVAEPRAGTREGLYAIDLGDGRSVMRGENELVLEQPVVVDPGK